jgi:hypothetical protein
MDNPKEAEVSQVRSKEAIEGELQSVENLGLDLYKKQGQLSNDQRMQWEGVFKRAQEVGQDKNRSSEEVTSADLEQSIFDLGSKIDPPVSNLIKDAWTLFERQKALEEEYHPYAKEDFQKLVGELSSRMDYDAMFDYLRSSEDRDPMKYDLFLLRKYQYDLTVIQDEELDTGTYVHRVNILKQFLQKWEKKEFLLDKPQEGYKPSPVFGEEVRKRRKELNDWVAPYLEQLEDYNTLRNIYTPTVKYGWPFDQRLADVVEFLDTESMTGDFKMSDLDPALVEAAHRHISKVLHEHAVLGHINPDAVTLEEERERIDAIDIEEVAQTLKLEGFNPPEGMITTVTSEDVLFFIKKLLPPDFLRQLDSLSHKEKADNSEEKSDSLETTGACHTYFAADGSVDRSEIEIYRSPFVSENASDIEKAKAGVEFLGTLWHEFGHNAHHVMRYDEMKSWEDAMAADKTAVTWYVKYSRGVDSNTGKREDFADSFKLFMLYPAVLNVISPLRFLFMTNYFKSRLQSDQWEGFRNSMIIKMYDVAKLWEKNGQTQEDIIAAYLYHEEE